MWHHVKCSSENWEVPRSPHFRFEAHTTRFPWDQILLPLVTQNSIVQHMATTEGVRCISIWDYCHKSSPWKNILLLHTFPHHRTISGAPQRARQHCMGRKLLSWNGLSLKEFQFSPYSCVTFMWFLGYFIKRETIVSLKTVPLDYCKWWELRWIWPQMNADAIQVQITVHANIMFLFCNYFMHITLTFTFWRHLWKPFIRQTFAESDAKRGTNISKEHSTEMKTSTSICEMMSLLFTWE